MWSSLVITITLLASQQTVHCLKMNEHAQSKVFHQSTRRLFVGGLGLLIVSPLPASCFPNPLTSKPLELLRILDQDYADNIHFNGELADVGIPNQPVLLLIPITRIEASLLNMSTAIEDPDRWETTRQTLKASPFTKASFKKTFNAFSDNIYYDSESGRANAYLGGGAAPSTLQTNQYLLRNEILSNVEMAASELDYLIGLKEKGSSRAELVSELEDLRGYFSAARTSIVEYLDIPLKADVELARKLSARENK
jgi:hypothetical protein